MRKSASITMAAGLAVALGVIAAPAAMAYDVDVVVQKGGPFVSETGPGDLAYSNVEDSIGVETEQLDKSVEVGDLYNKFFGKGNWATFEIEGAEQDQGERS